jgi:hypothetical protein
MHVWEKIHEIVRKHPTQKSHWMQVVSIIAKQNKHKNEYDHNFWDSRATNRGVVDYILLMPHNFPKQLSL